MKTLIPLLLCACSAGGAIILPLDVIGPEPYEIAVEVIVPEETPVDRVTFQTHGLSLPNKGSFRANDGPWIPLNNKTVSMPTRQLAVGGIGGEFHSLKLTIAVSNIVEGTNTLCWRYDDVSAARERTGYRVLNFNLLTPSSQLVIPLEEFHDIPEWEPPSTNQVVIAEGNRLFNQQQISHRGRLIEARCGDCHMEGGKDLKLFNYSLRVITEQCRMHGLDGWLPQKPQEPGTPPSPRISQGEAVASYIASLPIRHYANARPWNPPYQPGPWLDSRPVDEWIVGAGLNAVLDDDVETFKFIFPDGIVPEAIRWTNLINLRETPVAIQYPDWNHWLPEIHPKDAWGTNFLNHPMHLMYLTIRANVQRIAETNHQAAAQYYWTRSQPWFDACMGFFGRQGMPAVPIPARPWPLSFQIKCLSTYRWAAVKRAEIVHEFSLEDFGNEFLGSRASDRTWPDDTLFNISPHLTQMQIDGNPLGVGTVTNYNIANIAWYQLGVTLKNSRPIPPGNIDWPYNLAFQGPSSKPGAGWAGIMYLDLVLAAQVHAGLSPGAWNRGWQPWQRANVHLLVPEPHIQNLWKQIPADDRVLYCEAYLVNWLDECRRYAKPDYMFNSRYAYPAERWGTPLNAMGGRWIDRYAAAYKSFKAMGVNQELLTQLREFAENLWPANDWQSL